VKKDLSLAVVAVLVVAGISYLLATMRPDRPPTPSKPFTAGAKAPSAKRVRPNDKVVMHVNGEPVTEREFNAFALQAPAQQRAFFASPQGRRALADELVKLKVLQQEGERIGLNEDPEVESQVESVRAQIVAGRALEKLVKEEVDKRLQAEYEKEKASSMSLRHVLVAYQGGAVPPRDGKPRPVKDAQAKAGDLVKRLRSGADFASLAKSESDDAQSAERGGSLGAARPDMLPPEIATVVSKLKPGQISDPVTTPYGVHIFKVETPSIDDLRPMLAERVQQQAIGEAVGRLQEKAKVELDPTFFPPMQSVPGLQMPPGAATQTR
jgi:peptidyl-prolyl cis-trans isomerase C